ncbi:hypothetical protein ACFYWX_07825 [Streptomyces sp. NPDC002888]|uniref:hypothetical protein n=1 Tax=Streptomyces sp. NPDC002888 TaxID=3364668 RepID=UPI003691D6B7
MRDHIREPQKRPAAGLQFPGGRQAPQGEATRTTGMETLRMTRMVLALQRSTGNQAAVQLLGRQGHPCGATCGHEGLSPERQVASAHPSVQRYRGAQGLDPDPTRTDETWTNHPPPTTPFLGYVAIAPRGTAPTTGNRHYRHDQVAIRSVQVSEVRGPTRYGADGQKSHTTAWTLTREALARFEGREARDVVTYIQNRLTELAALGGAELAYAHALTDAQNRIADVTLNARPLHLWQPALSGLLSAYVMAYGLSPMTTYAAGKAVTRGEPWAMMTLRAQESAGAGTFDRAAARLAVAKLQDYQLRPSLSAANLTAANHHFWVTLHTAFPQTAARLRAEHGVTITSEEKQYEFHAHPAGSFQVPNLGGTVVHPSQATVLGGTVSYKLAPGKLDAGFGVDAFVSPRNMTDAAAVTAGPAHDFMVGRVLMSSEQRPQAQWDPQQSHFASWELVKRATEAQAGQQVDAAVTWAQSGLPAIQNRLPLRDPTSQFVRDWQTLYTQVSSLGVHAAQAGLNLRAHEWSELVSALLQGYVMLYNASSVATGAAPAGQDRANGSGEAGRFRKLDALVSTYASGAVAPNSAAQENARRQVLGLLDVAALRTKILKHLFDTNGKVSFADVLTSTTTKNIAYLPTRQAIEASRDAWLRFLQAAYAPLFSRNVLSVPALTADFDNAMQGTFTSIENVAVAPSATRSGKIRK